MSRWFAFLILVFSNDLIAKTHEAELNLKDHVFVPEVLTLPANTKVKLIINNLDDSIEEFDSFDLNREKVLFPKRKTILYISPLKPGEYEFFGEYHPHTARGKIVVKEQGNAN